MSSKATDKLVASDIRAGIRQLDRRIKKLEEHIDGIVWDNPQFREKSRRMCGVVGVGQAIPATVLAEMPGPGKISDKQASSLVGLAPFNNDSSAPPSTTLCPGSFTSARGMPANPTMWLR